jgi:hypothetical protein
MSEVQIAMDAPPLQNPFFHRFINGQCTGQPFAHEPNESRACRYLSQANCVDTGT